MPQLRNTAKRFISRVIPDMGMAIRTRPLEALIIGAYVRGLSDRDIESLLEEAGLGKVSPTTASRICQELRARYAAFRARSLANVHLMVLFLDAIYLWLACTVRRSLRHECLTTRTLRIKRLVTVESIAHNHLLSVALSVAKRRGSWPA